MLELTAKIRHFYDLHFLLNDAETQKYLKSNVYTKELPDLAYKDIPTIESIENSMEQLISYLIK